MKIGIAFSGGGLRGAYQVGCYKAFLDCHIKINGFVGTSIGSFNAAMVPVIDLRNYLPFGITTIPVQFLDLVKILLLKQIIMNMI